MKKSTIILALLLMTAMPMTAEHVTPETARKVAAAFLNNNGAKATQLVDLSKTAGFPNLYIFSTEESFVIMAADDCVKPILGYSLTNKFVVNNMPENMREWLQGYSDEIQFSIEQKMASSTEVKQQWADLREGKSNIAKATAVVDALIKTKWDQSPLYNNMCPYDNQVSNHTITGCVATTMAQILKYWGTVPTPGIGSHSYIHDTYGLQSADFGNTVYNWENMPLSLSGTSTPEQINEVARLMYHCGVSVDMDYGLGSNYGGNGSSAYSQDIPHALINYFNYSTTAEHVDKYSDNEEWKTLLKNELDAGRPIAYNGSGTGGHSFICDGYNSDDYFHFNWGWSGSCDNYYTLDNLKPGSHNFNNNQSAVIGIQPATIGQAAAPVLEVVAVQEPGVRNAQLTWNETENASAYKIYRNNNLIASISSGNITSYTDLHIPYGTSTYFIRSVDVNGDFSWPSNYACLTLTFSAPTNLAAEQTEDGVALSWSAGENAVSYNIYCNNVLIGSNISATTYTDTRIIAGTLSYFVKSVDTFGDKSDASDAAEITIPYSTPVVNNLSASLSGETVSLSWTAPQWCYPTESSSTLTYGSQVPSSACMNWGAITPFWGQRHLAERMSNYDGKKLYKVSFSINYPETYELYIYKGSTLSDTVVIPTTLIASQTIIVTDIGWNTIVLSEPIVIDGSQDLWIFMHNPNSIENFKTYLCSASNTHLYYYYSSNLSANMHTYPGYAFLIKAYLTDGTYTYDLYQDDEKIAEDIEGTTYSNATLSDNAPNLFTIKTNYYGGETATSNLAGFAKGSTSLANLEMSANDKITLTENSTLTVTGTLNNDNAANLILENGSQLIHNSEGVKATMKKSIAAYATDKDGWYFIASPVTESITPSQENGFLNGIVGQGNNTYDLYYYDEPSHQWKNYEHQTFDIEHLKGYLYANGETNGTTLEFVGTLLPSNTDVTINDLSREASELNGFNLVGNPFACNATIDQDCYVIDGNRVVLATTAPVLAPCEGVMVKATDESSSVTFTKATAAKGTRSKDCFDLVIMQDKTTIDRTRVRFGKGFGIEKFSLNGNLSQISLWQNGQDLAVAYANGANEMPVNFKANENGTYTISVESKNCDLDYLHLIDNLTGYDVDLLATPNYTFDAKATDYATRFKLVFSNGEDTIVDDDAFAYFNNGNIIINQEGTLQLVDITGRMVYQGDAKHCIATTGMPQGVYLLRLFTTDGVKTQKIVIK